MDEVFEGHIQKLDAICEQSEKLRIQDVVEEAQRLSSGPQALSDGEIAEGLGEVRRMARERADDLQELSSGVRELERAYAQRAREEA